MCPQCGTRDSDWMDPDTGHLWFPPRWEPVATVCLGCEEVGRLRRYVQENSRTTDGVNVVLRQFDPERPDPVPADPLELRDEEPEG